MTINQQVQLVTIEDYYPSPDKYSDEFKFALLSDYRGENGESAYLSASVLEPLLDLYLPNSNSYYLVRYARSLSGENLYMYSNEVLLSMIKMPLQLYLDYYYFDLWIFHRVQNMRRLNCKEQNHFDQAVLGCDIPDLSTEFNCDYSRRYGRYPYGSVTEMMFNNANRLNEIRESIADQNNPIKLTDKGKANLLKIINEPPKTHVTDKDFIYGLKMLEKVISVKEITRNDREKVLKRHCRSIMSSEKKGVIHKRDKPEIVRQLSIDIDDQLFSNDYFGYYMTIQGREKPVYFLKNPTKGFPASLIYEKYIVFSDLADLQSKLSKFMERFNQKGLQKLVNDYSPAFTNFWLKKENKGKYMNKLTKREFERLFTMYYDHSTYLLRVLKTAKYNYSFHNSLEDFISRIPRWMARDHPFCHELAINEQTDLNLEAHENEKGLEADYCNEAEKLAKEINAEKSDLTSYTKYKEVSRDLRVRIVWELVVKRYEKNPTLSDFDLYSDLEEIRKDSLDCPICGETVFEWDENNGTECTNNLCTHYIGQTEDCDSEIYFRSDRITELLKELTDLADDDVDSVISEANVDASMDYMESDDYYHYWFSEEEENSIISKLVEYKQSLKFEEMLDESADNSNQNEAGDVEVFKIPDISEFPDILSGKQHTLDRYMGKPAKYPIKEQMRQIYFDITPFIGSNN